jgi:hypothetical protein
MRSLDQSHIGGKISNWTKKSSTTKGTKEHEGKLIPDQEALGGDVSADRRVSSRPGFAVFFEAMASPSDMRSLDHSQIVGKIANWTNKIIHHKGHEGARRKAYPRSGGFGRGYFGW